MGVLITLLSLVLQAKDNNLNLTINMKLFRYCLFLFILFAYFEGTYAQKLNNKIEGNVLDNKGQPIEFALIKVNNSTIFTETDSLGFFILNIPENVFKINVIITRIGFQAKFIDIKSIEKPITIYLENDPQLDVVQVVEERSKYWKRKLKIFKESLLGDSPYVKSCKILNENDIIINVLESDKMEVTFKNNLKILNNDLGYILEIYFTKVIVKENKYFQPENDVRYSCFFYEQTAKDANEAKKWKKNREDAFENSLRGFLVSLIYKKNISYYDVYQQKTNIKTAYIYPYNSKLMTEIDEQRLLKVKLDTLAKFDTLSNKYFINSKLPFLVFSMKNFSYQSVFLDSRNEFTYVCFLKDKLYFDKFGWSDSQWLLRGFWAKALYSVMLPQDYLPEKYLK